MDTESEKVLNEILGKEPAALTEPEIAVLRARASYLTPDQKATYAGVLASEPPAEAEDSDAPKSKASKSKAEAAQ